MVADLRCATPLWKWHFYYIQRVLLKQLWQALYIALILQQNMQNIFSYIKVALPFWLNVILKNPEGGYKAFEPHYILKMLIFPICNLIFFVSAITYNVKNSKSASVRVSIFRFYCKKPRTFLNIRKSWQTYFKYLSFSSLNFLDL